MEAQAVPLIKTHKIDKPVAKLIGRSKKTTQAVGNKRGDITPRSSGIKSMITDYYKQLYGKKFDNLNEMDKFLERYKLVKPLQEELHSLNLLKR